MCAERQTELLPSNNRIPFSIHLHLGVMFSRSFLSVAVAGLLSCSSVVGQTFSSCNPLFSSKSMEHTPPPPQRQTLIIYSWLSRRYRPRQSHQCRLHPRFRQFFHRHRESNLRFEWRLLHHRQVRRCSPTHERLLHHVWQGRDHNEGGTRRRNR